MGFPQALENLLNSGDPEVRTWFLVRNDYLPFILCASYATFSSYLGPTLMKNRKPFDLRIPMIIFNFSIVTTYVVMLSLVFWNLPKLTWEEFCIRGNVVYGGTAYLLARCAWFFYLTRYVEFSDTVFFVLRKKENLITFLHVMHHTIVPLIGWVLLRTERSGFQSIPCIINSSVHVVMYTYYGLAAMGPQVRRYLWWKKYLTQLQIIQFIIIIVTVAVIGPYSGCSMVKTNFLMVIIGAFTFLYLFYRYYQANFPTKSSSTRNGALTKRPFSENGTLRNRDEKNGLQRNEKEKNEVATNGRSRKDYKFL